MIKFANIRLPVIIAFSLICGIAAGYFFEYYKISLIWLIAVAPLSAITFTILSILFKNWRPFVFTILACIFFILGALGCYFKLVNYSSAEIIDGNTYRITGTVFEKGIYSNGEYIILNGTEANNINLKGKIIVYLNKEYGDYCDIGYKVTLFGIVNTYNTYPYGKLNYYAEENVKYRTYALGEIKSEYGFSFFGTIRNRIKNILFDNLSSDTAAICYAMLTGNSQNIDDDTLQNFRYGGIAHIFAVSGLHVGIIFGILSFLCKKLKINKYVSATICIFAVFFYSAVCGFTLSSVRAATMCAVSIICKLFYQKSDRLNTLAFAATAILLITPLSLFSAGFQLSFCAVGGISVISKTIERLLKKIKTPQKIASGISVSLGAQAGTLPIMLAKFGYLSGAGLLLNIIIIPILSVLFTVLFASTFICALIAPLAKFLIPCVALPLELIISFLVGAGFEKALISGFGAGLFVPLYFILLIFAGDKLNIKFVKRIIAVLCSMIILTSYVIVKIFLPVSGFNIIVSAYYSGGEVLIKSVQGNILIVTEDVNGAHLTGTLSKYYAGNISGIIILGGEDCLKTYENVNSVSDNIYIFKDYINLQPYVGININYEREFTLSGIDFEYADGQSIFADLNGTKIAVCSGENIPYTECDLLISKTANYDCMSFYTAYFNLSDYKYNVYDFGDLTYFAENGSIKVTGIYPPVTCLK